MRWLSNMISSSSSSSDDTSSPTKKHGKSSNILGFRVSVGGGGGKSKLTRQSEIRYLTDQEVVRTTATATTSSRVNDVALSRSQSSSSAPPPTSRSSSSVAVPLPLPLPVPDHSFSSECDPRLPSPKERDRIGDDTATEAVSSAASPISSACVGGETKRTTTEHLDTRMLPSSKVVRQDLSSADNSKDKFRVYVPARSAPTSPFGSPVPSPQTRSNIGGADLFPYYNIIPKGNQGWSATEMPILDVPGISPPAFFDYAAYSTDNSPLHSPPNRSPPRNTRSPNGPASPAHARLPIDACTARRDSNASHEVHPLPLPPGAAMSSPSPHIAQPMAKPEPTPMKCQWQKGKLIGRGTFGSVYIATNRETGALCAMKEVELFPDDPKSAESIKQLEQEIKVLSQLKHPNIVQYYGSEIVEDRFFIYLEYVYPGSINRYVHEHCGAITESVVRSFTRHILSGLAYLHSTKTIHRDIKGANLLVDASGTVKLADFGMAKHLTGQAAVLSLKGSPYWMAPELMQAVMQKDARSDLALAVDIWSLGCTIIEMFTGKPPWSEYEGAAAMFKVMRDTPPIPEKLSPEGKDFLRCCFRRNPAERPSASVLLEHRWMKNSQSFEVPGSNQSVNGIKSMDVVLSPRASDVKLDQLPMFSSSQRSKGKVAFESFMHYSGSPARLAADAMMKLPT